MAGVACVVDTSTIIRLGDEGIFGVIPGLFECTIIPVEVLDEIINHQALKDEIEEYRAEGKIRVAARNTMDRFERASYDAAMDSMRPYLSDRRGLRSNIGEMSVVATAAALAVPIVLMDDSEAEGVIARIEGIRDQIGIFRSVAVVKTARFFYQIPRKTERACLSSHGFSRRPSHAAQGGVPEGGALWKPGLSLCRCAVERPLRHLLPCRAAAPTP